MSISPNWFRSSVLQSTSQLITWHVARRTWHVPRSAGLHLHALSDRVARIDDDALVAGEAAGDLRLEAAALADLDRACHGAVVFDDVQRPIAAAAEQAARRHLENVLA